MADYRSRSRYVWRDGKLVEIDLDQAREVRRAMRASAQVLGDIPDAFTSPVDGSVISSRAALREHNKRNGVVDIGDENAPPRQDHTPLPPFADDWRDAREFLNSMTDGERANYMAETTHMSEEDRRHMHIGMDYSNNR